MPSLDLGLAKSDPCPGKRSFFDMIQKDRPQDILHIAVHGQAHPSSIAFSQTGAATYMSNSWPVLNWVE